MLPDPPAPSPTTLSPGFKLVFLSVLTLPLLSLAVVIFLAISQHDPSEQVKGLIETCSTTFKMGFGAIVGLIGGKAL